MGEPEPESEQIRLKCIRKEGFFTVPPEHRIVPGTPRRTRLLP
uniref:Cyclin dependent kinase 10 n=2 Tax=Sus scrofa TaxID=9823 RepID=A0A4X1TER2_PIG